MPESGYRPQCFHSGALEGGYSDVTLPYRRGMDFMCKPQIANALYSKNSRWRVQNVCKKKYSIVMPAS
eukprot:1140664-Pelagomonas_calceolata.AAC.2